MQYFFDKYELSDQDFCLKRDGVRVAIEPKALRVLLVLVRNKGKLLEKKAILEAVWVDTFVEESTLTRAVALLRKQLRDDPRSPTYIETVPTLGYRFIAEVVVLSGKEVSKAAPDAPENIPLGSSAGVADEATIPTDLPYGKDREPSTPHPAAGRTKYFVAAAVLVLLGGAVFMLQKFLRPSAPTTKDTILLADFSNTTGDPVFDDSLREGLMIQLEQSPVLRLANEAQIRKTLRMMKTAPEARLTSEVSREVCLRIGGNVLLEGSISRLGSAYVVGLRARSCSSGEELTAEQIQIERKEDALKALSGIATRFRTVIGESHASIRNLDIPLEDATTSSLDALKSFSQGVRTFNIKGSRAAIPLFTHAIEMDPEFAIAHVWLGRMYADLGEEAESIVSTQKAHDLREKASDRERFLIDVSYELLVSGDLGSARETCEAWQQMYPRDVIPHSFLSGIIYPAYGRYEQAVDEAKAAIQIDPDFVAGYRNEVHSLIALDRLKDADEVLKRAAERKLFLPSFVTESYRIAFLQGDEQRMKRAVETAPNNPWLANYQAATLLRAGHWSSATVMSDKAVNLARQSSRRDTEAQLQVAQAITEAVYGYSDTARVRVKNALERSTGRNVKYGSALVMALAGDAVSANRLIDQLAERYPHDTLVRYNFVPTVRAAIALTSKQPKRAVELLRDTTPFELGQPFHSIYIRGQALLAMGQPNEAAAEFQKMLVHPGLIGNDPLFDLALLQRGRCYALVGDTKNARANYEALLALWKDADKKLSITQQVQTEYSRLAAF